MLLNLFGRLAGLAGRKKEEVVPDAGLLALATEMMHAGDLRAAIKAYRGYLETDPTNVLALNDMGVCLAEVGDLGQAAAAFELAYTLDDTFMPVVVNHAKMLVDHNRCGDALPFLERAKICQPALVHAESVLASLYLKIGDAQQARAFQLKAWLTDFDNLRAANGNLFWLGYDVLDDDWIAAEHRFWAETLKPLPDAAMAAEPPHETPGDLATRRVRIGYWSADFRNHSVRYFFRPLLEGHDRERFEIFLYHDYHAHDAQTELIEPHADHFHDVHELSDTDLMGVIRSHDLDILVDLAGHTSYNRVNLLQARLARLQMNALGYPPTTGLASIDLKLIDLHVSTPETSRYYAETPLALPGSFWCFDPMEDAPIAPEPPLTANGHITFGAVGNIAKITEPVAKAWREILTRVPESRLLVRSASFQDPEAIVTTRARLQGYGLPDDRIDFRMPEGGQAFFESYNEIDIILDTFPFNGGTTTCFATYMGVPVVTIHGKSLISRMGLSMLTTLGVPDLAVDSVPAYVERAVRLAENPEEIRRFRQSARPLYNSTPLGNGKLFAREFEAACVEVLERLPLQRPGGTGLPVLPADEIIRRAYSALSASQADAGQRIVAHCLRHYPDCGPAHMLQAQLHVWKGAVQSGIDYLRQRLATFTPADRASAAISIARMQLLLEEEDGAASTLRAIDLSCVQDAFDRQQVRLYLASLSRAEAPPSPMRVPGDTGQFRVLVPCDDLSRFALVREQLMQVCEWPAGWSLSIERCSESGRIDAYRAALEQATADDVLLIVQKHVEIHQPRFASHILDALAQADCVGSAGASRWGRMDWRADEFAHKAGGFISPSTEREGRYELHVMGLHAQAVAVGMAVLDGAVLAIRLGGDVAPPPWDADLTGCETLLEERWTHELQRQGGRLAVHCNLGVCLTPGVDLDAGNRGEARMKCATELEFKAFGHLRDDHSSLSVPVASIAAAIHAAGAYFGPAD